MFERSTPPDVLVIGAGVVGAAVAYELARRGVAVTVVDEGGDVGNGCSHANAGLLAPSHVEPLTTPMNLRLGSRYVFQRDSPFHITPSLRIAPWLVRFALSSTPARARRLTATLQDLAWESLELHRSYAAAGLRTGFRQDGSLDVFLTESRFAAASGSASGLTGHGLRTLSAHEARDLVPGLGDIAGAVLHPQDATCETRAFARAALNAAQDLGAQVRWGTRVERLLKQGSRVTGAQLSSGRLAAGAVVVAAGLESRRLVAPFDVALPLIGGKGYVLDVPRQAAPRLPLTFKELRVVATPYADRLRFCGTMDLGDSGTAPVARRVQAIRRAAAIGLPSIDTGRPLQVWAGQRPCLADGIPAVGSLPGIPNLHLATGHGMWGLVLAPITGSVLADGIAGAPPDARFAPFSPERFAGRPAAATHAFR